MFIEPKIHNTFFRLPKVDERGDPYSAFIPCSCLLPVLHTLSMLGTFHSKDYREILKENGVNFEDDTLSKRDDYQCQQFHRQTASNCKTGQGFDHCIGRGYRRRNGR